MIRVRERAMPARRKTFRRLYRRRRPVLPPPRNRLFHLSGRQKTIPQSTLPEVSNPVESEDSNHIRWHILHVSFSLTEVRESSSKSPIVLERGETSIVH